MLYLFHAYAPDLPSLRIATARVRELDPSATIYISNDPTQPIPPSAQSSIVKLQSSIRFIPSATPRSGNLNGAPFILSMLDTMEGILTHHHATHIIKIDADAYLNSVEWLNPSIRHSSYVTCHSTPDLIYMEGRAPFSPAGDCYTISIYAIRAVRKALTALTRDAAKHGTYNTPYPEDATIITLTTRARLPIIAIPYHTGLHRGITSAPPDPSILRAALIHTGEPLADGTRAPREFIAYKMQHLWALTHPEISIN